ncbi:MAG: NADH-quinone oxidoreductase subunit N [Myxococcota bacterium]
MNTQLQVSAGDFALIAPLILVGALAFVVLLWDAILKPTHKGSLVGMTLVGLAVAAGITAQQWSSVGEAGQLLFSGLIVIDKFGLFTSFLVIVGTFLVVLMSRDFLEREDIHVGEYYALLLFALFGMQLLALSSDLVMTFIGIEVMSISVYVLAAFNRSSYRCIESALKYFILGAFASGFLLYGIALLYGHTGTTQLGEIGAKLMAGSSGPLLTIGIGMLLIGFAFKVGAAPFHMWAPDVYEGASSPVTAFMATTVKAAAFASLVRVAVALAPSLMQVQAAIAVIAAITVVVGNVAAIRQDNLKRMLAYSGIAHTGYMFAGLLAIQPGGGLTQTAVSSIAFYLTAYVLMNLGAFVIVIMVGRKEQEPVLVSDWAGLGFKYPLLGAGLTLFMLSMGGLPPTAGFFAKFYLFAAILDAGYTWLVILAVLTSAASFYYYLRVVVQLYMHEPQQEWTPQLSGMSKFALAVTATLTVIMGLLPSGTLSVLDWARQSVLALL